MARTHQDDVFLARVAGHILNFTHTSWRATKHKDANLPARSPFTLPCALRHRGQRRTETVGVVRDVAVIAQKQPTFVTRTATTLAHGAVEAAPAFPQNHLSHLRKFLHCRTSLTADHSIHTGNERVEVATS